MGHGDYDYSNVCAEGSGALIIRSEVVIWAGDCKLRINGCMRINVLRITSERVLSL